MFLCTLNIHKQFSSVKIIRRCAIYHWTIEEKLYIDKRDNLIVEIISLPPSINFNILNYY